MRGLDYNLRMHLLSTMFVAFIAFCLPCLSAQAGAISRIGEEACAQMKTHGVLKEDSPVSCQRLRIVSFSYLGFDDAIHHDGEIMVLDAAAEQVRDLFDALRQRGFPIARARLMHRYGGDDAASMRDNNTSGFNHRAVTGRAALSLHAYGLAIDINPVQNPFLAFDNDVARISPQAAGRYVNRSAQRPGKPARKGMAEDIVHLFAHHGFPIWGGDWDDPIDYQHFQVSRTLAERLAGLPADAARKVFAAHAARYRLCMRDMAAARPASAKEQHSCRQLSR